MRIDELQLAARVQQSMCAGRASRTGSDHVVAGAADRAFGAA